jgi:hypothetical protein
MGSMQCNVEFGYQLSIKVKVTLRPTISRPVRHGVRCSSGTRDQFFPLLEILFQTVTVCYFIAPSLTRARVCNLLLVNLRLRVEVEVNLRPTVSRPVCPGVRRPSGTCDQLFFRHEFSCRQLPLYYFVAPSLTRGRVCNLLLNCFWALPEQSLLSRSPTELTAIFYCLI